MSRKLRIHYFKAFYHTMIRGNNSQPIFSCDADRNQFCHYLSEARNLYDCKVHLFCLMTNHIHLVIEVGHVPLTKIIHNVSSRYARFFNKTHNRKGYLFEGRYQAILVQNEKYLLELCYYIHMNPIKAGLAANLDQYNWSSHQTYNSQAPTTIAWVTTDFILNLIKKHIKHDSAQYSLFMYDREKYYEAPLFCSFDQSGNLVISDAVNERNQSMQHNKLVKLSIDEIAKVICEIMKISQKELTSCSLNRHIVLARSMVTYFAHYRAKFQLIDIANYLERNPASISKTTNKTLKLVQSTPKLEQLMHDLEKKLLY